MPEHGRDHAGGGARDRKNSYRARAGFPRRDPEAQVAISISASFSNPPTIDGVIKASEWASADSAAFTISTPYGTTFAGSIFVMRDASHLTSLL